MRGALRRANSGIWSELGYHNVSESIDGKQ
jgi:hypothetical protein